ncbi:MAG: NADH-quinone oxidoreductase subunit C, partial [Thiobacillus sp.]|nr:NADH-quinone oxidoreductase subunit C [Thiobacillus sp.]
MPQTVEALSLSLENVLGDALVQSFVRLGELTLVVKPQHYESAMRTLRDHPDCRFEQLIDLCGVDYSGYGDGAWEGARFAVVAHLLSVSSNQRVRVRVFCPDDDLPVVASMVEIWPSAN